MVLLTLLELHGMGWDGMTSMHGKTYRPSFTVFKVISHVCSGIAMP